MFREAVFIAVAMEWLLRDEVVQSVEHEYRLKRAITFDLIVGRSQIFTGVSRGCFPSGSYGISIG